MLKKSRKLKGVIFDLDGTLVDSGLDFDLMRRELGIEGKRPVLEFVTSLPEGEFKRHCWETIKRHEMRGAEAATVIDGVPELLARIGELGLKQGILTRNLMEPTCLSLGRLGLSGFDPILTRECAPPKPDPAGLFRICGAWDCSPEEVIFVGDFLFDVLTGKNAGVSTVLYSAGGPPKFAHEADLVVNDFLAMARRFESIALNELRFTGIGS